MNFSKVATTNDIHGKIINPYFTESPNAHSGRKEDFKWKKDFGDDNRWKILENKLRELH